MRRSIRLLLIGMIASLAVPAFLYVSNIKEANASVGNYSTDASTYYKDITATNGKQLAGQLHDLIATTHRTYTTYDDNGKNKYQQNTDQYYENGQKVSGYIYEFYSGVKWPNGWYPNAKDTKGGYNREHCWCQSNSINTSGKQMWGEDGGGADMHHLRPVETRLNSTRNNHPYGEVTNRDSKKSYAKFGTNETYALGGYTDTTADVFEPLDSKKGDVARILFYTYIHYNSYGVNDVFGGYASTNGNGSSSYFSTSLLPFTKITNQTTEANALKMLLKWNANDPVDEIEQRRNEQVAIYQGNRNPFIDNSSYADMIWGTAVGITSISKTSVTLTTSGSTTVSAVSSNGGNITWTSSNTSVATVSPGTASSGSDVTINALSAGSTTITASITISGTTYSKICSVKVNEPRTLSSITLQDKKTEYNVGDEFIMPTVIANYSNSSTEDVSNLATQSGFDSSTAGEKEITISYTEGLLTKTAKYTITVSEQVGGTGTINFGSATGSTKVDALSVTGKDDLENDWTVTTIFPTEETFLSNEASFAHIGSSGTPASSITFTTTFASSCAITSLSIKLGGYSGTNGTVNMLLDEESIGSGSLNGGSDVIINNSSQGTGSTITISITGISKGVKAYYISYTYGDIPVVLDRIEADITNVQTEFTVGDTFNYDGLIVTAYYSDESSETLDSFDVVAPDMSTSGTKTVSISYTYDEVEKETSYEITVNNAVTLASISVTDPKTSYYVGDTFVKPTVTATYSDETSLDVTNSAEFSGYDLTEAGDYTVTVSYSENGITETTSYEITVTNSSDKTVVTQSVEAYATANNWESNKSYDSMIIDSNITASTIGEGNTGKYIESDHSWRLYQFNNSQLKITAADGYVINSVEFTFTTSAGGLLIHGDDTLTSETAYLVNASSITFSLSNSGDATNGQVRITNLKITYHQSSTPSVIESISAVANKNFAVGEMITSSDITVTANTGATITDFTFGDDNYQFKYEDATSGGSLTEKTFTNTITYGELTCDLTVNVSRTAYVAPSTTSTSYTGNNFEDAGLGNKPSSTETTIENVNGMSFKVTNCYIYSHKLSPNSSYSKRDGVLINAIPYSKGIKNVAVNITSNVPDFQLSVDGSENSWVDLASAREDTNYYYFKVFYKNPNVEGYVNITSITVTLKGEETPTNLANYIMYTDTNGQCEDKFSYAESYFENLSSEGKITFMTSTDYVLSTASERFRNWAAHQGKQIVLENSNWVIKDVKAVPLFGNSELGNETALIAIVAILSGGAMLSYFFLKKRKYN